MASKFNTTLVEESCGFGPVDEGITKDHPSGVAYSVDDQTPNFGTETSAATGVSDGGSPCAKSSSNVSESGDFKPLTVTEHVSRATQAVKTAISNLRIPESAESSSARLNGFVDIQDVLRTVQNDLWDIRNFLLGLQGLALIVLMETPEGKSSSKLVITSLEGVVSNLSTLQYDTLAEFAHRWDGHIIFRPILRTLKTRSKNLASNAKEFRKACRPHMQFADALTKMPFRVSFPRVKNASNEKGEIKLKRIIRIGQAFQPIAALFGKRWVGELLGKQPTLSQLREIQVDVIKNVDTFVQGPLSEKMPTLESLHESIIKELTRVKSQHFCVAFCGMVKAGKSLFLNALTGRQLLPSDELPATAWPCRVRHDLTVNAPSLTVNAKIFEEPLKELQCRKINAAMEEYKSLTVSMKTPMIRNNESNDSDSDGFSGSSDESSDNDDENSDSDSSVGFTFKISDDEHQKKNIYREWKDLHEYTRTNLKIFEQHSYFLPDTAVGDEAVANLLGKVNDIVRLCRVFKIAIPETKPDAWPLLSVRFESLRDVSIEGSFEFIDLPGLGEARTSTDDFYVFEDLIRTAALKADTVVPIISFKEVSKADWRKHLPKAVRTGLKRPPDFVLCTHMDHIQSKNRIHDHVASVGKAFWPISAVAEFEKKILRCSTRSGVGARLLLDQSKDEKPEFSSIWDVNMVMRDCAESILGVGNSRPKYERIKLEKWTKALREQLQESGLQEATTQLTDGILNSMQGLALRVEGKKLAWMMRKIADEQSRQLLEMSRSEEEYKEAYEKFLRTRNEFEVSLSTCEDESLELLASSSAKLFQALGMLRRNGLRSAVLAIESASKYAMHCGQASVPKCESGEPKTNELVFSHKYEVEEFYHFAQKEMIQNVKNELVIDFVQFVRKMADQSRRQLLEHLAKALQSAKEKLASPELVEDILDKLEFHMHDVEVLFSANFKSKVIRTDVQRYNIATAYTAIQRAMAKPFLPSSNIAPDIYNIKSPKSSPQIRANNSTVSDLGFMIHAPIAVLATVPLVLGSFVWPLLARNKKFVVDKDKLVILFQQQIQTPYFSEMGKEAKNTLDAVIARTLQQAKILIKDALRDEQARFDRELYLKKLSIEEAIRLAVSTVSIFWNLSSAAEGLDELQPWFDSVLTNLP